jgi:hypothetical protein
LWPFTVLDYDKLSTMRRLLVILLAGILGAACSPSAAPQLRSVQASIPEPKNTVQYAKPVEPTLTIPFDPTPIPAPTIDYQPISWRDLNVFLSNDHTNWNRYIPGKYTCVNFAMDLVAAAHKANIDTWIVAVEFDRDAVGHAFVAFLTTDMGVVWIEPQSDYAYDEVEIGQPLCYAADISFCQDYGRVTKIEEPVQCDVNNSTCWLP